MTTYFEKLKHPLWQRRRLEVLNRAGFKCEECHTEEVTLHVHHRVYRKGADPWDYPDEDLVALCEACHETRHAAKATITDIVGRLADFELDMLLGYARAIWAHHLLSQGDLDAVRAHRIVAENAEQLIGVGHAFQLTYEEMLSGRVMDGSEIPLSDLLRLQQEIYESRRTRG